MKISKGLKQAYAVQDFAFDVMMALKENLATEGRKVTREDSQAIAAVGKVWREAQERSFNNFEQPWVFNGSLIR